MKVLSIDLDICFEQGSVFRKYMNYNIDPTHSWKIMQELGINMMYDVDIYRRLKEILKFNCKDKPVVIINEHDEILQVLRDFKCWKADLFHFDAHHDIGYSTTFEEPNIENWVVHAKIEKLVDKVTWTHNCSAEFPQHYPFLMLHDNILDIKPEYLPDFDLVVLCVSRQFTPMKYWDKMVSSLYRTVRGKNLMPEWLEEVEDFDFSLLEPYGDYMIDGKMPDVERIFKIGSMHIVVERDRSVSMFKFGDEDSHIFKVKEAVDWLLNAYGYLKFHWVRGCRNVVYIERLLKNYKVLSKDRENATIVAGEVKSWVEE